jgi:D-alanyl-D-alanine carboxypeptidase
MNNTSIQAKIENNFHRFVNKNKKVRSAYLLVHSPKLGIHLNLAAGTTNGMAANTKQACHMASVGKLFTATVVGMLHDRRLLSFDDKIAMHLDADLMNKLHVYKETDYSNEITISHLLKQTSGLNDVFYHLYKKFLKGSPTPSPREAVIWGKENLKPKAVPGKRHFYTDTNYYLLGLIVESVTGKAFHDVVHEFIFEPLEMNHAYYFGYSKPIIQPDMPPAKLYIDGVDLLSVEGLYQIDYAGGGIMAPLDDYLLFMKALTGHRLVSEETLHRMLTDDVAMGFPTPGFNYGYSIWKWKPIPFLLPKNHISWGCVGITSAFMFYHPVTESYIIGTFNNKSTISKALQFMMFKVVNQLS